MFKVMFAHKYAGNNAFFCHIIHLFFFFYIQYLEENVHQTYVDVGVMARHLQEKYREYQRRKALPFRQLVDQGNLTVNKLIQFSIKTIFTFLNRSI